MNDFKIEYLNGRLVALDVNGLSLIDLAIKSIEFTHKDDPKESPIPNLKLEIYPSGTVYKL